jgi:hypothetical protein
LNTFHELLLVFLNLNTTSDNDFPYGLLCFGAIIDLQIAVRYLLVIGFFVLTVFTAAAQSEQVQPVGTVIEQSVVVDLYPNPATEEINIRTQDGSAKKLVIEMHNIIGNRIQINPEEVSPGHYRIVLEDLTRGYYLLSVREEGRSKSKAYKFLKK